MVDVFGVIGDQFFSQPMKLVTFRPSGQDSDICTKYRKFRPRDFFVNISQTPSYGGDLVSYLQAVRQSDRQTARQS